ncbi:CaiB/BaiF CoA-transferase family protein [Variovorax sp. J22P240]|uniref:CaiB/BaiF CoA transferase family protein n=1 Tax=Variovorax sp. J22P240 TaxID=3053514 RepID=UPI00257561AA|nr:CaiB/BaiF CoA-transferase family protein [Variovorax sp. J22P240]MDM0001770.1 CaiB/BaiF CoA-transferase family protein [Variovorax sp. J22P240]
MAAQGTAPGALAGVRVLDLSRVLAGPSVTQMLADLGADVIKVERPDVGDEARTQGTRPAQRPGSNIEDTSGFSAVNRGKRSIELDLASPGGQAIARRLACESDILVENFKTGDLKRYGLDYESLAAINPRLVYCSITGFGQTGPYRLQPGYDLIFQAMSGLMSATGGPEDEPGGGPQRVGYPISDATAGLYATIGILAALHHRNAPEGRGQHIDLALLDAQIAAMTLVPTNYLIAGQLPRRVGIASLMSCPYQAFDCADGQIVIAVNNAKQFSQLCRVLGLDALASDERYASNASRVAHRAALVPVLAAALAKLPVAECRARLTDAGVPCGPLNDMQQVFDDEQVRHRGLRQEVVHPVKGVTPILANPLKFSETPVAYRRAPPQLGEHTAEVLREVLGIDDAELAALRESRVVGIADLARNEPTQTA